MAEQPITTRSEPGPAPRAETPTCPAPQPVPQPAPQTAARPPEPARDRLPEFRVLLHNDDVHDMLHVVRVLCELTPLPRPRATLVMLEAHSRGVSQVLTTHRERAELYVEQLRSKGLTSTCEPV